MSGIFISYRRQDSADVSGRIHEHLVARYGKQAVFMDVDTIPYGEDFAEFIQNEMKKCSVALVIIGPQWLDSTGENGKRRLDDPRDFVRVEIETALRLGIPVVPVLVSHARIPDARALPDSLVDLLRKNAAQVRPNPDFTTDMKRLCDTIDRYVVSAPAFAPQPAPRYAPVSPATSKSQGRSVRRGIVIGVIVVVLACGGAVLGVVRLYQTLFPPHVLTTFCNAIKSGDIDTAFNDLSSSFQGRTSRATFLSPPDGSGGQFVACSASDPSTIGNSLQDCRTIESGTKDVCVYQLAFTIRGGTNDGVLHAPYCVDTTQENRANKIDSVYVGSGTPNVIGDPTQTSFCQPV